MKCKMKIVIPFSFIAAFCILNFAFTGCGVYSFSEKGTLDPNIKTVYVQFIQNQAPYVNPQLSPNLTDRLQQKITRQTKLTQIKAAENANLLIVPTIRDYSVVTTGVSSGNGQKQSSINRLTITVQVVITNQLKNETKEHNVSRSFDFPANQTLQQAEAALLDEMVRNLSDEIFNRIFSDW